MIGRLKTLHKSITHHQVELEKLQSIINQQEKIYQHQSKQGQCSSNIDTKVQEQNEQLSLSQGGQCLIQLQQKDQHGKIAQKMVKIEDFVEQTETSMVIQKVGHKNTKGKYLLTLNPKLIQKYSSRQIKSEIQRTKSKTRKVQLHKSHEALQTNIYNIRNQLQNIKQDVEQNREQFFSEFDFVINLLGMYNLTERKAQRSEFQQANQETLNTEILQVYPKRVDIQEIIMEDSDEDEGTCQEQASCVQDDYHEIESLWHHKKTNSQAVEKIQKKDEVSEREGEQIWNNFLKKLTNTHIRKIQDASNISKKQVCTQDLKQNHVNSNKYSQKLNHGLRQSKNPGNDQNVLNNKNSKGSIVQLQFQKNIVEEQNNKLSIDTSQLNFNHDFFDSLVGRLNSSSGNGSSANTGSLNSIRQSYNTSLTENNKDYQLQINANSCVLAEQDQSKDSHRENNFKNNKTLSTQSKRAEITGKLKQFKKTLKIDQGIARFNLAIK